jgi:hypothetical protein
LNACENVRLVTKRKPSEMLSDAWHRLDTLSATISYQAEKIGYYLGVLMGAKLMGVTHIRSLNSSARD